MQFTVTQIPGEPHFGPGWRMYYVQRGDTLIVMLGGGDKSTQQKDIDLAQQRAGLLGD